MANRKQIVYCFFSSFGSTETGLGRQERRAGRSSSLRKININAATLGLRFHREELGSATLDIAPDHDHKEARLSFVAPTWGRHLNEAMVQHPDSATPRVRREPFGISNNTFPWPASPRTNARWRCPYGSDRKKCNKINNSDDVGMFTLVSVSIIVETAW